MRRITTLALAVALTALMSGSAVAGEVIEATPEGSPNGQAQVGHPGVECKTIQGNPQLEHEAKETPPPPAAGEVEPAPAAKVAPICPAGTLAVTKALDRPVHKRPFAGGASAFGATPFLEKPNPINYYYVAANWTGKGFMGAIYYTAFSDPVVPAGAISGAHTLSQVLMRGGASGQYTLELGWTKELVDQEEGYKGARPFFIVNPDNYGPLACYDCGLVLLPGAENPFGKHYGATDGSPAAEGRLGVVNFRVMQYKGAWWIGFSTLGTGWVGRVSNNNWGKHFTKGNEADGFGEVYEYPSNPITPMGNGNKGGCTCATAADALQIATKPPLTKELVWTQQKYQANNLEMTLPSKYTYGSINSNLTQWRFGG
jgi:hypothetical protein